MFIVLHKMLPIDYGCFYAICFLLDARRPLGKSWCNVVMPGEILSGSKIVRSAKYPSRINPHKLNKKNSSANEVLNNRSRSPAIYDWFL